MKVQVLVGNDILPTVDQAIEILTGPSAKGPKRCLGCQSDLIMTGSPWGRKTL